MIRLPRGPVELAAANRAAARRARAAGDEDRARKHDDVACQLEALARR